jgi:hypothetical protein
MSAACNIIDGLITHLTNASLFGPNQADDDYGIMNTTACCAVVGYAGQTDEGAAFGFNFDTMHEIQIGVYVKEINPKTVRSATAVLADKTACSLRQDHNLGALNASRVNLVSVNIEMDPDTALEIGGTNWLEATMTVVYGVFS